MKLTFNKNFYKTWAFWLNLGLVILIIWPVFKGEAIQSTISNWLILGIGVFGTLRSLAKSPQKGA
ncbi:hypothetical protein [Levilactobacillus wangkuiensis]|uniref:hypothetical protein n=1 Tax=Levilactobacillus wangkuiensis TaxID=2799566 RepID=UPI001941C395|nr:hypothetical protein [Levilactobacillus wangkuiensis]